MLGESLSPNEQTTSLIQKVKWLIEWQCSRHNVHCVDSLTGTNVVKYNNKTMFMVLSSWQSHCESSPGLFDECRTVPSGHWPKTKPDDVGCESACTGCQNLHPPSPFIITQPESWYSFYRPTEGRRLSWHSWLVTYRDGLPVHRRSPILVLTGSKVAQLRWSRPNARQMR